MTSVGSLKASGSSRFLVMQLPVILRLLCGFILVENLFFWMLILGN